jgi:hypothetical protein
VLRPKTDANRSNHGVKRQRVARIISPVDRNLQRIRKHSDDDKKTNFRDGGRNGWGEVAALCKASDHIEVVSHAEYLDDTKKIRWF